MSHEVVREAIDRLTVELGEKRGSLWEAQFSVKDVLEKADMPNTPNNQRYVIMVLNRWYTQCSVLPGQGDSGGFLSVKIRSR